MAAKILNNGSAGPFVFLLQSAGIEEQPAAKQFIRILRSVAVADGDKVAVMWTSRGTHVAEWFGLPATGKSVVTQGVDIFLMRDGRLAEHWDVVDVTNFLVQAGALPGPVGPGAGR